MSYHDLQVLLWTGSEDNNMQCMYIHIDYHYAKTYKMYT